MSKSTVPATPKRRRSWLACLSTAIALLVVGLGASVANALNEDYALNSESASISTDQAGAHPNFVTNFKIDGDPTEVGTDPQPWARFRSIAVQLPPGLTGNPAAFPQCDNATFVLQVDFSTLFSEDAVRCPRDSQVGIVQPGLLNFFQSGTAYKTPLYNLVPPGGESNVVARLGFIGFTYPLFIDITLDPKRGDALTATLKNIPGLVSLTGSKTTIWGVPTDSSHNGERHDWFEAVLCAYEDPSQAPPLCSEQRKTGLKQTPFMSNPTSCGPTAVGSASWSYQGDEGPYFSLAPMQEIVGCAQVPFNPSLSIQPTTRSAGTSAGVDVDLQIPQPGLSNPKSLASAHLKKAVIELPEGISLNPSAAEGLASCSEEEIGVDKDERQIVATQSYGAPVALEFEGQKAAEVSQLASASAVQSALEALPNIAAGDVSVSGRPGGPWTVDFGGSRSVLDVGQIGGSYSELQRIAVKGEGGTYTLTFEGETTEPLAVDANAATVEAALENLNAIGPGQVDVIGEAGSATTAISRIFRIAFRGGLAQTDVPAITATSSLTGFGSFASVYQLTDGGSQVQTHTVKQGGTLGFNDAPASCPQASKVGSGEITTPVLDEPLKASLYLANQNDNPFNSLLAGYMVARGAGATIKVAGKFDLDPETGRLVATFDDNPQQPFSELELHFKGGNRGVITTPSKCGTYASSYELIPWSGTDPVKGTSEFTLDENCDLEHFAPGFNAGSSNPLAGAFTDFALRVTRAAGTPRLTGVTVNGPEGLTGRLAGIATCPDSVLAAIPGGAGTGVSEMANPACPVASEVGSVVEGAGSGSPVFLESAKVFLAGPYKGAPISLAIVAPAVAGPFDLGNVVVRTAIYIDSKTAQLRAVSDPLPTIHEGIPLDLRDIRVRLNRPGFVLNPTSCDPMAISGTIFGTGGLSTDVFDRFQVGECSSLGFKPRIGLRLSGGMGRLGHPVLTAVVRPRPGDANISSVSVAFPQGELLDQAHIGTVCTRVQFAADNCPKDSVYGEASVSTPLLDYPLTGPVYLRSSDNELPDLVTDLRGIASQPLKLEASGRTDTVGDGALRNTFDFVPDAPFSKFVLKMKGGKHGLLVNSESLCEGKYRATVRFGAHNGRSYEVRPKLGVHCGGGKRHKR